MNSDVSRAYLEKSKGQVDDARGKIDHCLAQLQDEDVWWTPREGSNSIGIVIQHLMGNLRQWVISGVGGEADVRNRPGEFRVDRKVPKAEVQAALSGLLDRVNEVYSSLGPSELLEPRRIQGFDTAVLDAIYDTTCHLALHTGQILYLTRLRLGEGYRVSWEPASKEQGA
jgi:hypothetical protein